ncbi:MafB protein, partial [Kingella kingae]|nr:MafB protein [Kingella kingae]
SLDGKITIIKDNENNYFRIYDSSRKQYLDSNGNVVKTGNLQGKQAKDYLQQQTHIRNLDK